MELAILDFIQNNLRTPFGDAFFPIITVLGDQGIFWIVLALVLIAIPKTRQVGKAVLLALFFNLLICNLCLKPLVSRLRPFYVNTSIKLLIPPPSGFSFPSGHSCTGFTAVSAMYHSRSKLWSPSAVLASVIAFSRLYLYVHYPTDVLGGMLLGILIGWGTHLILRQKK